MATDVNKINAYASAIWAVARAEGNADDVADEMFRFARALEGNDELRTALSDQRIEASRRQQIVQDLLGGRASDATIGAVSLMVATGRSGDIPKVADRLVELGATTQSRDVARVRSAVELTEDQKTRLRAALVKATGRDVDIKVIVDPTVVGGVVTQIGDTVLDGSVRSRLLQLRENF